MNSKKVYLRPRPRFYAGALEDYECGCTHAPYSTLVSTLQTKNMITSYEAPNKTKNAPLISMKTIKTYDNKPNGGEKTFARSATMATKQRISPPIVEEDRTEKKWTIKERPKLNASKLEDDHQCGCTHTYYNSVIMDIRTKYQEEFENDKDSVVKKKRIKSTAAVGDDFFDQSYSSRDISRISKQKSIRRKKNQQEQLEDDDDDNILTNQSASSKTSVSVKRKERKTSKKKRNKSRAEDEDEEDDDETNKSATSKGTIKSSKSKKSQGNESGVIKRKAKKRMGKVENDEDDEDLSPTALLQAINDIQEGVESKKAPKKLKIKKSSHEEDEKEIKNSKRGSKSISELAFKDLSSTGKTPKVFNSIENKHLPRVYSSSELPELQPTPPIGNKTDRVYNKKGIKYNNKFLGYDNDEEKRFAQFGSLTLKKTIPSKTPRYGGSRQQLDDEEDLALSEKVRLNKMPSISGINTPKSHRGKFEGYDYDDEDMSSKHGSNRHGSFEDSDEQGSYSTSSKTKKKKTGATSLADLGAKEKQGHQKSRFGLLPSVKSDKHIDMSGLTPSKTKKYKSKKEFGRDLDLAENEDGGYTKKCQKIVGNEVDDQSEQDIEEENRMLEHYQSLLRKKIKQYEDNNRKMAEMEAKAKEEEMMVLIRELANNEQAMETAEGDLEKAKEECRLAAEQEKLDKEYCEKLQVKLTGVRKKTEDSRKEIKKLGFETRTSGKNLSEIEVVKKEFDETNKELEELNKKFAALRQKNYVGYEERMQKSEQDRVLTQDIERTERGYKRLFMNAAELEKEHEKMKKQAKDLEGDMKHFENSLKFKKSQAEREYRGQRVAYQKDVEDAAKKEKLLSTQTVEVERLIALGMKKGDREIREVLEYLKWSMEDDEPTTGTVGSISNFEEVSKPINGAKPTLMRGQTMGFALNIGTETNLDIEAPEDVSGKSYAMTSRNKIVVKNEVVRKTKEAEDLSSTNMKMLKRSGTVGEIVFPEIKSKIVKSVAIGEGFKIRTIASEKTSVTNEMRKGKIVAVQQPDQTNQIEGEKAQGEAKKVVKATYKRTNSAVVNKDKIKTGI